MTFTTFTTRVLVFKFAPNVTSVYFFIYCIGLFNACFIQKLQWTPHQYPIFLFLQESESEIPFLLHYRQGLDSHILRFKAELVSKSSADKDRHFVISYYLCDDTISVYENPLHNTGNAE